MVLDRAGSRIETFNALWLQLEQLVELKPQKAKLATVAKL